jgi:hypothetical protein
MKLVERNQRNVQRTLCDASLGGRCEKESVLKGRDFSECKDYPHLARQLIDNG